MQSRILEWFLNTGPEPSVFQSSRIFGFLSKILGIPQSRQRGFSSLRFLFGKWLLAVLLFSCIFIPRIPLVGVASFYQLYLRTEDLLMAALLLVVFPLLIQPYSPAGETRIERNFVWFLLAAVFSILNGLFYQTVDKPFVSLLYLLKWFEYFFVFVIACRLASGEGGTEFFLKTFFWMGIFVASFGYWEYFFPQAEAAYPNYYRLFERPPFHGDANHMGGFLVLWIGFFTGLFLKAKGSRKATVLLASLVFVFFPLVWTYSRKSYFALAGMLAFPLVFQGVRKRLLWLMSLYIVLALFFPTRLAERLTDLGEVFSSPDPFHSSWAGNWVMWNNAFWNFDRFFILGSGLGARHRLFYESQYILVLTETGILGFSLFLFLCLTLVREAFRGLVQKKEGEGEGMAFGWLIGFVGLAIHSFSCVSWTVAKIAVPFWFLTGGVLGYLKRMQNTP